MMDNSTDAPGSKRKHSNDEELKSRYVQSKSAKRPRATEDAMGNNNDVDYHSYNNAGVQSGINLGTINANFGSKLSFKLFPLKHSTLY